jgi:hypothetical protein
MTRVDPLVIESVSAGVNTLIPTTRPHAHLPNKCCLIALVFLLSTIAQLGLVTGWAQ